MRRTISFVIRTVYCFMHAVFPIKNQIVFLSRQSNDASLDFRILENALREQMPSWKIVGLYHLKQSLGHIIRDTYYVATSRICILDGYSPVVSIPKIDQNLLVVQLWHALGAIKKFGWQAVGTDAGRSNATAEVFSMHNNYISIIAAGEGCVEAYSEAFKYSAESIKPLGLPRMDYLTDSRDAFLREENMARILVENPELNSGKTNILYVPTFRKGEYGKGMVAQYTKQLSAAFDASQYNIVVKAHPLSSDSINELEEPSLLTLSGVSSIDLLGIVDYVVTDYSAIAFEASAIRKKVLFYIPDIDAYRNSPGLNIDVQKEFPDISFKNSKELASFVANDLALSNYETFGFWSYCASYLSEDSSGSTQRIVDYLKAAIG